MIFKLKEIFLKKTKIARLSTLLLAIASISISTPVKAGKPIGICQENWSVKFERKTLKIPYCHNYSLEKSNPNLTRAIVVIHGARRNAQRYYQNMLNAAIDADSADRNTMIIAPQFLTSDDLNKFNLGKDYLYWTKGGWKSGSLSRSSDRPFRYSSYSVVDDMVKTLANSNKFPNLKEIIIVGHSAGGQFVNRYAAGSLVETDRIHLKYIVINPSSYLYLDSRRFIKGSSVKFAVLDRSLQDICPDYDEYKYGLEDLYNYMKKAGVDTIRKQYARRDVVYLLGSEDNNPDSNLLAKSCPAMFQGSQRLERGIIYYNYLKDFYGYQPHTKVIVPGVGHNSKGIFNSPEGRKVLFANIKIPSSSANTNSVTLEKKGGISDIFARFVKKIRNLLSK